MREMSAQKKAYTELFKNYLINLVCVHLRLRRFRPLITNLYVTKRCNLKCRYCYPPGEEPDLDLSVLLSLLEKIRPHGPVLNLTGGEPLLYPDISRLIHRASELEFYPIIFSTNGLLLENISEDLDKVDHLVISLDSLSTAVNDMVSGVKGVTQKILRNIEKAAKSASQGKFHLSIHTVLAPETLSGLEDLLSFCESLNISMSVSPEHGLFYPNDELRDNRRYVDVIDRLIAMKQQGRPIACSYGYLKSIRDFKAHRCFPFILPRVEPDGRVYFPCQRIKNRHVYLQDYKNLKELMQQEAELIHRDECRDRCFLACYIDVEQYLKNPFTLLRELPMRRWVFGRRMASKKRPLPQ